MAFDLGGLLQQYLGGVQNPKPDQLNDDFDQVAQNAPPAAVGQGLSEAFRSDQTPPFAEMIGKLFGNANSQQQAGMLSQLISGLSPALLASVAGGLGGLLRGNNGPTPAITPEQAAQLTPEQVQQIADRAEQQNPGIIDKMSDFYAEHPGLVKTIGSAALAIALAKIAEKMRS